MTTSALCNFDGIDPEVLDYVISIPGDRRGQTIRQIAETDDSYNDWIGWAASHYFLYYKCFRAKYGYAMFRKEALPDRVALAKFVTQHAKRKQYWKEHYLEWAAEPLPRIGRLLVDLARCPECGRGMQPLFVPVGEVEAIHDPPLLNGPATWKLPHHYEVTLGDGVRMHCQGCDHGYVAYNEELA